MAGDTYEGTFKVYQTEGEDLQVTIDLGHFVYGSGSTDTSAGISNLAGTNATHFVYVEFSYSAGLVVNIANSTSHPVQTDLIERFVLAEVDVLDSVIAEVRQIQYGEIHSTRIWN